MTAAGAAAFAAGCLGAFALAALARAAWSGPARRLARSAAGAFDALARAGSEGASPGTRERRRLLALAAAALLLGGTIVGGPTVGVAAAAAGPWAVARLLALRRERYRREVAAGTGQIATAVADALSGGHSVRGALSEAGKGLTGAPGREMRRVRREIALGAGTEPALEGLRERVPATEVDTLVTAILLQRGAGGDLARLLRDCADAFAEQARLEGEVRAATAQARYTGMIVVVLPLGGAALAELAAPGFVFSVVGSPLTAALVVVAMLLQVAAGFAIRRLGRVRP